MQVVLSNPHNASLHTRYLFTFISKIIFWKSTKQTLVARSSNHSEFLTLYEVSQECIVTICHTLYSKCL